jgi:topoisomerase-4 subunit A
MSCLPEDSKLLKFTTKEDWNVFVGYVPKKGMRILEEVFPLEDFLVKGVKAAGVRLTTKEIKTAKFVKTYEYRNPCSRADRPNLRRA